MRRNTPPPIRRGRNAPKLATSHRDRTRGSQPNGFRLPLRGGNRRRARANHRQEPIMTVSAVAQASGQAADAADNILLLNNIEVVYDRVILVLKGVSLKVARGGIVALLGANGAGKSTTLKAISNLLHAERGEVTKGSIVFDGEEVKARAPNELVRRGCIQVMEGRHCFEHLTVEENLLTGAYTRRDGGAAVRQDLYLVYSYFPRLRQRRTSLAGSTSGGEPQK